MKRAEHYNMAASDFARTLLVHSNDGFIRIVDVESVRQTLRKLARRGTNLDQLMRYLNTIGASSYDSDRTRQAIKKATETFEQVTNVLIALREEMAKHGVA